jgi:hypothetical protein
LVIAFEEEALDSDLIFKILEYGHGLVGKTVNFGLSEIKPVMILGEDVVDKHKNSDNKDNNHKKIARVEEGFAFQTLFEEGKIHIDIHQKRNNAQSEQDVGDRFFVGPDSTEDKCHKNKSDADVV